MPSLRTCPKCGVEVPGDALDGLCPKCVAQAALGFFAAYPKTIVMAPFVPLTEKVGDRIGRYKLLEQIGEGGCGVVYMAEQEQPIRRRVALKVIKLGMDTKEVVARFEAERQALALMDHPNIAKVLDAGATEAGRPYFVMELVRGIRITDFCNQRKLPTRERLALFMQVCQAIQHAHQKGIIHRDIKPSNILVTLHDDVPVPKVIDFGIAKATTGQQLSDKTLFTAFAQFIGTPAYMSPEQAELSGLDIDTRSDIYSLGMLLYELLTGQTPFDAKRLCEAGLDEIRRIIREEEPPRPSTRLSSLNVAEQTTVANQRQAEPPKLISLVRGDLDWIVMKCLEKDRTRRYETATGLTQDIERYLNNEPVTAAAPGAIYRMRKFVRRHRYGFATATAIVLLLIAGVVASMWQAVRATRAEREQTIAKEEAVRQKDVAEYQAYVANIANANAALSVGESRTAQRCLSACPEHLRNWEWRYLKASCDQSILSVKGHSNGVCVATYSPDGLQIATGCEDGTVTIMDAVTGKTRLEFHAHKARVGSLAYSPDGKRIATASGSRGLRAGDKTARIWDAGTGRQLTLLQHESPVNSVAWNPNGKSVVTAAGTSDSEDADAANAAWVWDAETGQRLLGLSAGNGAVVAAAFSPDGGRIVTGEWLNTGRVWDASTGKQLLVLDGGAAVLFHSVAFNRDGTQIISAAFSSHSVRLWDAATGKALLTLHGQINVNSAAFSHDGLRIASGESGGVLRVWEAATGRLLHLFCGHSNAINTVAFSPDDSRIVTASKDGTCRVWNSDAEWSFPVLRGHTGTVSSAGFSPDDSRIVTAGSNWENITDKTARIWDAATGNVLSVFRGHEEAVHSAAYSSDGRRIVTASDDQTARVWDASTGKELLVLRGHTKDVSHASFSPDGSRIVTTSGGWYSRPPWSHGTDHTTRIWDATTGKELLVLSTPDTEIHCAAFSPDGTRIAIATGIWGKSNTCSAQVWNVATGKQIVVLRGHTDKVFSVAWSSDGSRIVTAGWDCSARVWDAVSGKKLLGLRGHNQWVHTADFSPDGKRIVTASNDQTARIWDATTGKELLILRDHILDVYSAKFSHDGTRIVTCSKDGTARVWDSVPRQQRYQMLLTREVAAGSGGH